MLSYPSIHTNSLIFTHILSTFGLIYTHNHQFKPRRRRTGREFGGGGNYFIVTRSPRHKTNVLLIAMNHANQESLRIFDFGTSRKLRINVLPQIFFFICFSCGRINPLTSDVQWGRRPPPTNNIKKV